MSAVLNQDLVVVSVHKIDSTSDVDFGDEDFVFGLQRVIIVLVFDDVADFADFALTGRPQLDQTLRENLVAQI